MPNYPSMVDVDIQYFPTDPMTSLTIFMESAGDDRIYQRAFRSTGQSVVDRARRNLIANNSHHPGIKGGTGDLYKSVYAKLTKGGLEVGADVHYASHVEYGFRHYKTGQFVPAKPYLRPAIQSETNNMAKGLGDEIQREYTTKLMTAGIWGFSEGYQSFGKSTSLNNIGKFGGWTRGDIYGRL